LRKGILIIMTAPSGTGKSTVAGKVLHARPNLAFSVSHTTRPIRAGEVDGEDYYFVDDPTFDGMVKEDAFAEWAHVHARRYGTSKAEVQRGLAAGHDVLFDIDPQGGIQLMEVYPDAVTIFMVPPALKSLEARLRGRGTETAEQLEIRLSVARSEIAEAHRYQYVVVNEVVEHAVSDFIAIIDAERQRTHRQTECLQQLIAQPAEEPS
jgi:guanylate kinase